MTCCENCNQLDIEIQDIQYNVPTIFGILYVEMSVCKTCKSAIEFCVYPYQETFDYLTKKLSGRANQLHNSIKKVCMK